MFADTYEKARAVGEVQRLPFCPADYFVFLSAAGAQPEPKRIRPESPVMGSLRRMRGNPCGVLTGFLVIA